MQVLVWYMVLRFMNPFLSHVLFARGEQGRSLRVALVTFIVYLAISLAIVPVWGGIGTAWSRIAGASTAACVYFWFVFRPQGLTRPLIDVTRTALAAVVTAVFAVLLRDLPMVLVAGAAALLYVALLLLLRVVTMADVQRGRSFAATGLSIGLQRAGRLLGRA
jgi:O-antigen/teichoic acid export membrane protein